MSEWNDFNDAEQQQSFDLIPRGTVAPVRMTIKPGGYDDASQGWSGGYATQSFNSDAVYLACEFVVLDGAFAKRKVWSNIGLHSPKGPAWANMGRTFVRAILNSARNVQPRDSSPQAVAARQIQGLHELDGIEFIARIEVESDNQGERKNVIKAAVEPGQAGYGANPGVSANTYAPTRGHQSASPTANGGGVRLYSRPHSTGHSSPMTGATASTTAPTTHAGAKPAWAE